VKSSNRTKYGSFVGLWNCYPVIGGDTVGPDDPSLAAVERYR
jgi:hypothetical protein